MSQILNQLAHDVPWKGIGEFIAASGIISTLLVAPFKYIKKWFEHHTAVMTIVTLVVTMSAALIHYIVTDPTYAPGIAVLQGLSLTAGAKTFFDLILRPLLTPIARGVVSAVREQFNKAEALNAEVKSAAVPTDFSQ